MKNLFLILFFAFDTLFMVLKFIRIHKSLKQKLFHDTQTAQQARSMGHNANIVKS